MLPGEDCAAEATRLADKYLEQAGQQLLEVCRSSHAPPGAAAAARDGEQADGNDMPEVKTRIRGLLISIAATTGGLLSRLPDFDGFGVSSSSRSSSAWPDLKVVGCCAPPIGAPGVRNRAAAAVAAAIVHLKGSHRDLLEQACRTAMLLLMPGVIESIKGGGGRSGGKDDGAIIEEPAAATAFVLARQQAAAAAAGDDGSSAGGSSGLDASGFVRAFCAAEARVLAAAADAPGAAAAPQQPPGPGSWGQDWRWRRRTSPKAVADRLRRMLLWRNAHAASNANPTCTSADLVSPRQAAEGYVATPVGCLRLHQLPREYALLFCELLGLLMAPNDAVRVAALGTLQACVRRFPCLIELVLPELLAAIAGVPGLLLGLGGRVGPAVAAAAAADWPQQLLSADAVARFYGETLQEVMQRPPVTDGPPPPQQPPDARPAAVAADAAAALAAAAERATAAAAAAAAAGAGAGAGAPAGSESSAAKESENDGRVLGACALLNTSLDAWRVVLRDPLTYRAFVAALMASRCHSSTRCRKALESVMLNVRRACGDTGEVGS